MITVQQNKNNNRCDPIIMLAGKLGGFENSATSFKTCIQDIQPVIYSEIKTSYDSMNDTIKEVTSEMKTENDTFLAKLKSDYETKNGELTKNIEKMNTSKEKMNTKINATNASINQSLNKINSII
jgi:septal ring factor EnvC (AmiA/AmiB activator)